MSKTTEPLVSVLIPVYNTGKYLRPSVESILSQTYSNLEIIMIDDGSTDHCMDTIVDIKDPRMHIITQENAGKAVALNRALKELSSTFYAIQDADDLSYPRRIELQVQCMLENPELAAVFTGYDIIIDGRRIAPRFSAKTIQRCRRDIEQMRPPTHDPNGMFRVSMVRDISYEPALKVGQGVDYILRVGERHPIVVLGECLYSYRIHFESTTRQNIEQRNRMNLEVARRACQRRGLDPSKHLPYKSELVPSDRVQFREREAGVVPHFMQSVFDLRSASRNYQALKTALFCLQLHPCNLYYYKPLAYALAPLTLIKSYRSRKS